MMYHFTVPMALMDYLPVLFFGVTAILLQRDLYNKMSKGAFALFAAGTINVFCAGFLKATWKLLYAAAICDFDVLNSLFLPLQSIGFLLLGLGLLGMLLIKKRSEQVLSVAAAPVVFKGTFVFIGMMIAGLGILCTVLSTIAVKMKKAPVMLLFILAFVGSMAMGYMASHDSASAAVNWIEQSINTASQLCLMIGVLLLHKAGLADWQFTKKKAA